MCTLSHPFLTSIRTTPALRNKSVMVLVSRMEASESGVGAFPRTEGGAGILLCWSVSGELALPGCPTM